MLSKRISGAPPTWLSTNELLLPSQVPQPTCMWTFKSGGTLATITWALTSVFLVLFSSDVDVSSSKRHASTRGGTDNTSNEILCVVSHRIILFVNPSKRHKLSVFIFASLSFDHMGLNSTRSSLF